jgi:ACS family tartrate transporter-like MFS transporter
VASTASGGIAWSVATLSIAMVGLASMFGPFWALATSTLSGTSAAASIAVINSVGNTGGFVGPYLLGAINDSTHSFAVGLFAIAAMLAAGGALVLAVRDRGVRLGSGLDDALRLTKPAPRRRICPPGPERDRI